MFLSEQLLLVLRILCAEFLILGLLYISYTLASYLVRGSSAAVRLCATITAGMWLSTLAFNSLITVSRFNLLTATVLMGLAVACVSRAAPFSTFLWSFRKDFAWLKRIHVLNRRGPYRWVCCLCIFFVVSFLMTIPQSRTRFSHDLSPV